MTTTTQEDSTVTNPEERERLLKEARSEIRAEKQEAAKSADTKRWLEGRLDEQTREVTVMGRDFDFRPLGTDAVADTLAAVGNEDLDLGEMPGLLRQICDHLADSCTDPAMDRAAWGQLPPDVVEGVFEDVAFPEDGIDEEALERVEKFRDE